MSRPVSWTLSQPSIYTVVNTAVIKKSLNVTFLLVFVAGGWGNVLAAALCEHRECMSKLAEEQQTVTQESNDESGGHCSKGGEPPGHDSHESKVTQPEPLTESTVHSVGGDIQSCTHCMSAPTVPPRGVSEATQTQPRRDMGDESPCILDAPVRPAVASFPALVPHQGSPPTPTRRRHILIQTFLL